MHPSLVVLLTLLKSTPATGANNIFQAETQNTTGAGAAAGSGWGTVETNDDAYINIPYGCHELNGKTLNDCIDQWYNEYYADEVIPDECIKLSGLDLHNCIESYKSSISESPSSSPTLGAEPLTTPPTARPSMEEIYHTASLPNDVTTMVELPSDSNNPDATTNNVNTSNELQSDFVPIAVDGNTDIDPTIVYGKLPIFCFLWFFVENY